MINFLTILFAFYAARFYTEFTHATKERMMNEGRISIPDGCEGQGWTVDETGKFLVFDGEKNIQEVERRLQKPTMLDVCIDWLKRKFSS